MNAGDQPIPAHLGQPDSLTGEDDALGQGDVGDRRDERAEAAGAVADDQVGDRFAGLGEVEHLGVRDVAAQCE